MVVGNLTWPDSLSGEGADDDSGAAGYGQDWRGSAGDRQPLPHAPDGEDSHRDALQRRLERPIREDHDGQMYVCVYALASCMYVCMYAW